MKTENERFLIEPAYNIAVNKLLIKNIFALLFIWFFIVIVYCLICCLTNIKSCLRTFNYIKDKLINIILHSRVKH